MRPIRVATDIPRKFSESPWCNFLTLNKRGIRCLVFLSEEGVKSGQGSRRHFGFVRGAVSVVPPPGCLGLTGVSSGSRA